MNAEHEHPARTELHPSTSWRLLLAAALSTGMLAVPVAEAQKSRPPQPGAGQSPPANAQRTPGVRYSGRLMIGDAGPDFSLSTAAAKTFRLHDLRQKQAVALVFLQRAGGYLAGFSPSGDSLEARDIRLVFLCQQGLPRHERGWPGLAIAHDRQGVVARTYGALDLISGDTLPAVFLLDKEGKLRYYAVGRLPNPDELQAITLAVLAPTPEE